MPECPGPVGTVGSMGWVLAHQGGWDEILMVVAPLLLLWGLLSLANRRARRAGEAEAQGSPNT